jgi:hypothetical protein
MGRAAMMVRATMGATGFEERAMATVEAVEADARRAVESIGIFLPLTAKALLEQAARLLSKADVDVDAFVATVLGIGESLLGRGLEWTTEGAEIAVERLYEAGVLKRLGLINSFLRDGAEIGIQLFLNTLKALEPADVAKFVAIALIAWMAPNLLLLNGGEFLQILGGLALKVWNLP